MKRALFALFCELGDRVSEMIYVKLKHITDKTTHYSIYIEESKTEARPIPIVWSLPYLIAWLNSHPRKHDPEAYLFTRKWNGEYGRYRRSSIWRIIKAMGKTITDKKVSPHMLRHLVASHDYGKLPEKMQMLKMGWSTRKMIDRYAHITSEDLENKVLELHGIAAPEETHTPLTIENKICHMCKTVNPGTAMYCSHCGKALDMEAVLRQKELKTEIKEVFSEDDLRLAREFLNWKKHLKKEEL